VVWDDVFLSSTNESVGEVMKELARVGGKFIALVAAFGAIASTIEDKKLELLPTVLAAFDQYEKSIRQHNVTGKVYLELESSRIAAGIECESRRCPEINSAAYNCVLGADCYLLERTLDDMGVEVFCARATHLAWRLYGSDRHKFWSSILHKVIAAMEAVP
jgi:hypothetical protein